MLQMAAHTGELAANVDRLAELVRKHADGAELVVAPELVTSGYDLEVLARRGRELAEPLDGPTATRVSELATETGATLVFGMLERDGDVLYDTAVVAAPGGELVPYRKSHLYPTESELFAAGTELVVASTPAGRLGMMICFEHAFPDVATTLALRGAQILVIPSAVPVGYEHLLTLRTRTVRASGAKIDHTYQLFRGDELICEGESTLACVDRQGKVQRVPEWLRLEEEEAAK